MTRAHSSPLGKSSSCIPSFLLGVTLEWLGGFPKDWPGMSIGKSSWGAVRLIIATRNGVASWDYRLLERLSLQTFVSIPIEIQPGMESVSCDRQNGGSGTGR